MAIWAEKGKVVGYINNLENYNAREIAKIATGHGLYEHIVSVDRGLDYANKVNRPKVWRRLVKAQLDGL